MPQIPLPSASPLSRGTEGDQFQKIATKTTSIGIKYEKGAIASDRP
ncbi:hypothetical protein [Pantanalinema sp. GBBB05]